MTQSPPAAAAPASPVVNTATETLSDSGRGPPLSSNVCSASSNVGSFTPSIFVLGTGVDDADSTDVANNVVTGFALSAEAMAMNAAMHTYHTTLASIAAMVSAQQPTLMLAQAPATSLPHTTDSTSMEDITAGHSNGSGPGISKTRDISSRQDVSLGQAWHQAEHDTPVRLQVAKAVIRLLEAGGFQQTLLGERFLHVVRRLELLLYSSSPSLLEYADSNTMAARLLVLVRSHRAPQTCEAGPSSA